MSAQQLRVHVDDRVESRVRSGLSSTFVALDHLARMHPESELPAARKRIGEAIDLYNDWVASLEPDESERPERTEQGQVF